MSEYAIVVCRGCRRKFRIYSYEVYPGDPNYCRKCNRETCDLEKEPQLPDEKKTED